MKRFDQFRAKRRKIYESLFSAKALCITGLLIMPALLFFPSPFTSPRVLLFLFFWFLAWLSGKKNNPVFTLLVIVGIVAFNLIIPYGKVLFTIGKFRITAGALLMGIRRAVTLEGLIMLSRFTIRPDLKLPGLFGELIGESFRIFSLIMNQKQRITRKNLIGDIDQMMIDLSGESGETPEDRRQRRLLQKRRCFQRRRLLRKSRRLRKTSRFQRKHWRQWKNWLQWGQLRSWLQRRHLLRLNRRHEQGAVLPAVRTKPAGFVILAAVTLLSWLPLAALIILLYLAGQ
ncbi:MAG: hypothetical protein FWG46_06665 [Treponema sp.]|nr:hypothetical protein [Treponema sp.]